MNDQSKECRDRLCTSMEKISKQIDPRQTAIILSGGVDTCAILEAAKCIGLKFSLAITVVIGDESPDKDFAIHAASAHNLEHHVLQITADDLVNDYLPATIRLLKTWDGMTLRNSLVISAAFKEAQRLGMKEVITGDAADELFGGYSFMWGCEDDLTLWKKKRDDMCHNWTFATSQLADFYEITAHQPFMDEDFVAWALTTTRKDCIGEKPIKLLLHGESIMHKVGKVILREAFDTCASWRRKDPIELGSGACIISKDEYWNARIKDDEYKADVLDLKQKGIVIQTKEHLINFRAYCEVFGGIIHPDNKRLPLGQGCAGCCFDIGEENFCKICGMWPAQRTKNNG